MADEFILAIETYGAQRVKHPTTGRQVSAYKIGYTSAAAPLLLALYGEHACDVSSRQSSYRYLQIDADPVVRHGYLLLTLTADELRQAEAIARRHHRAGAFLWRNSQWTALPNSDHPDYSDAPHVQRPTFDPTGFRPPSPSTGQRAAQVTGIQAERSQHEPDGKVWWWLTGDTYPHRELLKAQGARWSGKRKAWYWIGVELPALIQALLKPTEADTGEDPCSLEEAAEILGLPVKPVPTAEPPRLFTLDQTVYARYELETPERRPIPTGTVGRVTRLYTHNSTHGWSYDIAFEGIGDCWCFERELTDYAPVPGIRIQRGAVVPPGAVLPPTDAEIKRTILEDGELQLPESLDPPDEPEAAPAIRIIKPVPMPTDGTPLNAVQTAICETKAQPITISTQSFSNGRTIRIDHAYVGELTGSISGQVFCYGYAVHEGVCIYLNMGGPRMATEAIRAKLSKGEAVSLIQPNAPSIELTAGEGSTGIYHAYLHYLPEARFASLILVHDWAVVPNHGGKSTTFIFRVSDGQATARLKHHVTQLVNVPVFDAWSAYLYEAGQRAMLVRRTRSAGGIDLLSVDLDADAWTRLITGGLEQSVIRLPE